MITLGNPAIDRPNDLGTFATGIELSNRSNADGTLTVVEIFFRQLSTIDITFATFFLLSGNTWRFRAEANVGTVPAGFSSHAVNIPVRVGDGIGLCTQEGSLVLTLTGGQDKFDSGCFTNTQHDYGADGAHILSIRATGFEASGGQISVGHIQRHLLL